MGHHQFHNIFYGLPVNLFTITIGLIVLTLGRKLFWLFVGAIGFISGLYIATYSLYGQPEWVMFLIGLIAGIAGAIFAVYLQRFAVILSGFFAGGYLILNLVYMWGWHMGRVPWLIFLIGGIVGAVAAATFFDWALIILSSLTGATMITHALPLNPVPKLLVLAILIFIGLFIQTGLMLKDRSP
jgi:hypothetical protein